MIERRHMMTAILPCNHVARSRAFYERLGFRLTGGNDAYAMLADEFGDGPYILPVSEAVRH